MKKIFRRFLALALVLSLMSSFWTPAFAMEDTETSTSIELESATLSTKDCAEAAYYGLSPTAREYFLNAISSSPELVEFHRTYIDSSFIAVDSPAPQLVDPVSVVSIGVAGLGVATVVLYCLETLASEFLAALDSSNITVGDLYSYIISVGAISTLVTDWDFTGPKWSRIISIFCNAFPDISDNVEASMQYVPADVEDERTLNTVSIGFSGSTATINGEKYNCYVRAENFNPSGEKFYVAIRNNNYLYVCPKEISLKFANAIIKFNNEYIGVMCVREYTAYRLAEFGGSIVCSDNRHDPCNPNYLYHYHRCDFGPPSWGNPSKNHCQAHIWFLYGLPRNTQLLN